MSPDFKNSSSLHFLYNLKFKIKHLNNLLTLSTAAQQHRLFLTRYLSLVTCGVTAYRLLWLARHSSLVTCHYLFNSLPLTAYSLPLTAYCLVTCHS